VANIPLFVTPCCWVPMYRRHVVASVFMVCVSCKAVDISWQCTAACISLRTGNSLLSHCTPNRHSVSSNSATRQPMYIQRNVEARSRNHYCSGKAVNVTQPECVFVALGTQHAMRMCRIVTCGLSGCNRFATARFSQNFPNISVCFSLLILLEIFIILRTKPEIIITLCPEVPVVLVRV